MKLHRVYLVIGIVGLYGMIVNNGVPETEVDMWAIRVLVSSFIASVGLVCYIFSE